MANDFGSNPIYLDTFTSAINVGDSKFGDTTAPLCLKSIRWSEATAAGTATITDGKDNIIFDETCPITNEAVEKDFDRIWIRGLKIAATGVSSGKILIYLF